jgi:hypothetical protein
LLDGVIVGGAVVVFVAAFLPWWGGSEDLVGPIPSVHGWSEGATAWVGTLLLFGAGVMVALRRTGVFRPSDSGRWAALVLALSAVGFVLLLLRWLSMGRSAGMGVDVGPMSGVHLALIAGAVELAAAAVKFGMFFERRPTGYSLAAARSGDIPEHWRRPPAERATRRRGSAHD